MKIYFAIACLLTLLIPSLSKGHFYKQLTTTEGLISNDVYHIARDGNGNLWFCTTKGVVKYNGQTFEKFTVSNGLTDNDVFNCFEDSKKRIWFYTYNGKYCYYKDGIIYNPGNSTFLKKISSSNYSYINVMYEDVADGNLYIGHVSGPILKLRGDTAKIIQPNYIPGDFLRVIHKQDGVIKGTSFFHWFDIVDDRIINSTEKEKHDSYYYNNKLITADKDGVKLFDNGKLIWYFNDKDISLSNLYHLYYDGNGNIFCGTRKGLIVYNITDNSKRRYFQNIRITSTIQDIHGNYWLSSFGNGVYKLSKAEIKDINFIADIKDHDLILTRGGQIFLKKDNAVKFLRTGNTGIQMEALPVKLTKHVEPVYLTDNNFFHFGLGPGDNFCNYNLKSGITTINPADYYSKAHKVDSNRFLFLHTLKLSLASVTNDSLKVLDTYEFKNPILSDYYSSETGCLYFFLKNILYQYDASRMKLQTIDTVSEIGGNNIILVNGNYLIVILNNKRVIVYVSEPGYRKLAQTILPFPIYSITKIAEHQYVINTDNGYEVLNIFNAPFSTTTQRIVYPFQQKDILFLHLYDNKFICKIRDELYEFPKEVLNKHLYVPQLSIAKVLLNNKQSNDKHIVADNKTDIRIILSPAYFSEDKLKYKYRIIENNLPGQWHFTQSEELNFLFNSPADYLIEMQAISSGKMHSNIEKVRLTIRPSFFSSWPFYLICMVLVLSVAGIVLLLYLRRRRIRFENEMNYLQLEHKSINSLLNPHFIFNTINNIQALINDNSKEEANEYLATLSTMIRQNIENLQHSFITLEKELNLVSNYIELQNLRFENKIDYINSYAEADDIYIPPLLIHTFVENSIVHGYKIKTRRLRIEVKIERLPDNYLKISVIDNGSGLENTERQQSDIQKDKTSMGIAFARNRLERLSEFNKVYHLLEVKDRSQSGGDSGTEVTIIIYSRFTNLMKRFPQTL